MAESSSPVRQLPDITECPICQKICTDPRSLPCVHTFCLQCISKCAGDKQPDEAVECPTCRSEFKIPKKGIESLQRNNFVGKLLAVNALSVSPDAEEKSCDWCQKGAIVSRANKQAIFRCFECRENLCAECNNLHAKINATCSHQVLRIGEKVEDAITKRMPSKCDKHPDKNLEIHCFACEETQCIMCFVTEHNGHKFSDVNVVVDDFRSQVEAKISILEGGMSIFAETLSKLQDSRHKVLNRYSDVNREIDETADRLIASVERRRHDLQKESDQFRDDTLKEIDDDIDDVTRNKEATESLIKYCEELLKKGSNSDITRETKSIRGRVETIEAIGRNVKAPIPENNIVTFTSHVADLTRSFGKIVRGSQALQPTLTYSIPGNEQVSGMTLFNDLLYVTRKPKNDYQISVYDTTTTFQLFHYISVPGAAGWLYGLAVSTTDHSLYVADHTNKEVHRISLSSAASAESTATKWTVVGQPSGLSVNKSNNVLVALTDVRKVVEYTPSGSQIREVSDGCSLWDVIDLNNGTLAVSRNGPIHGVACLKSDNGELLHGYGSTTAGLGPGQMNFPRNLVIDKQGNVVVADQKNNRILVMNSALTEVQPLTLPATDPELNSPIAICLDEARGRLFIGESGAQRRVLIFDGIFNLSAAFLSS